MNYNLKKPINSKYSILDFIFGGIGITIHLWKVIIISTFVNSIFDIFFFLLKRYQFVQIGSGLDLDSVILNKAIVLILRWSLLLPELILGQIVRLYLILYVYAVVNKKNSSGNIYFSIIRKRFFPVLKAEFIGFYHFLFSLLALIVPGIIVFASLIFVPHAALLKNKNGVDALNYCKRIIDKSWLKVISYIVSIGIIYIVPVAALDYVADFGSSIGFEVTMNMGSILFDNLMGVLIQVILVLIFLHFDIIYNEAVGKFDVA